MSPDMIVYTASILAAAVLVEHAGACLYRAWRRHVITARRTCRYGHTWSRWYGPVDDGWPNPSHYWARRCLRCPVTDTSGRIGAADYHATKHEAYTSPGGDGWESTSTHQRQPDA